MGIKLSWARGSETHVRGSARKGLRKQTLIVRSRKGRGRQFEYRIYIYQIYIYIYIYTYTYTYTYSYIHRYTDTYTYTSRFARRATIDVDAIRVEKVLCSQHSWGLGAGWKVIPVTRSALRCYFEPVLAPKFAEAARKLRGSRLFSCPPPAHADGYQRLLDHRLSPFRSSLLRSPGV